MWRSSASARRPRRRCAAKRRGTRSNPPSFLASPATLEPGRSASGRIVDRRRAHRRSPFRRTLDGADVHAKRRRTDTTAGDAMRTVPRNETRSRTNQTSPTPRRSTTPSSTSPRALRRRPTAVVRRTCGRRWVRGDVGRREKSATKELLELTAARALVRRRGRGRRRGRRGPRPRPTWPSANKKPPRQHPFRLRPEPGEDAGARVRVRALSVAKGQAQGENARESNHRRGVTRQHRWRARRARRGRRRTNPRTNL